MGQQQQITKGSVAAAVASYSQALLAALDEITRVGPDGRDIAIAVYERRKPLLAYFAQPGSVPKYVRAILRVADRNAEADELIKALFLDDDREVLGARAVEQTGQALAILALYAEHVRTLMLDPSSLLYLQASSRQVENTNTKIEKMIRNPDRHPDAFASALMSGIEIDAYREKHSQAGREASGPILPEFIYRLRVLAAETAATLAYIEQFLPPASPDLTR